MRAQCIVTRNTVTACLHMSRTTVFSSTGFHYCLFVVYENIRTLVPVLSHTLFLSGIRSRADGCQSCATEISEHLNVHRHISVIRTVFVFTFVVSVESRLLDFYVCPTLISRVVVSQKDASGVFYLARPRDTLKSMISFSVPGDRSTRRWTL